MFILDIDKLLAKVLHISVVDFVSELQGTVSYHTMSSLNGIFKIYKLNFKNIYLNSSFYIYMIFI